jgi:hypothetical protein
MQTRLAAFHALHARTAHTKTLLAAHHAECALHVHLLDWCQPCATQHLTLSARRVRFRLARARAQHALLASFLLLLAPIRPMSAQTAQLGATHTVLVLHHAPNALLEHIRQQRVQQYVWHAQRAHIHKRMDLQRARRALQGIHRLIRRFVFIVPLHIIVFHASQYTQMYTAKSCCTVQASA